MVSVRHRMPRAQKKMPSTSGYLTRNSDANLSKLRISNPIGLSSLPQRIDSPVSLSLSSLSTTEVVDRQAVVDSEYHAALRRSVHPMIGRWMFFSSER